MPGMPLRLHDDRIMLMLTLMFIWCGACDRALRLSGKASSRAQNQSTLPRFLLELVFNDEYTT